MLKNFIAGALMLAVGLVSVSAQSNDRLDELLAQAQARLDSTAYLLMVSGGLLAEDTDPAAAFEAAVEAGFLAKDRHPEDGVTLEDLSYLVMKTQKIPGGVEWSLLPSPRAAYRELSYQKVINTSAGPRRLIAGDEAIRTLAAAAALKGGRS